MNMAHRIRQTAASRDSRLGGDEAGMETDLPGAEEAAPIISFVKGAGSRTRGPGAAQGQEIGKEKGAVHPVGAAERAHSRSGWNWTPRMGADGWNNPSGSPDSDQAQAKSPAPRRSTA